MTFGFSDVGYDLEFFPLCGLYWIEDSMQYSVVFRDHVRRIIVKVITDKIDK